MAQQGGYLALPNEERVTPEQIATALKKRGGAKNVTILTTQCLPRSSRPEDSFYDNLRKECLKLGVGEPAVFMESMENQPAILNPKTNLKNDIFQTLRIASENCKKNNQITGADVLKASNDVIGDQPSLILPPSEESKVELNNDLASLVGKRAEKGEGLILSKLESKLGQSASKMGCRYFLTQAKIESNNFDLSG